MVNIAANFSMRNASQVTLLNCTATDPKVTSVDVILIVEDKDPLSVLLFKTYCLATVKQASMSAKLAALMIFMRMTQLGKSCVSARLNTVLNSGTIRRKYEGSLTTTEFLKMLNFQPSTRLQVSWFLRDLIAAVKDKPSAINEMIILLGLKRIRENRLTEPLLSEN